MQLTPDQKNIIFTLYDGDQYIELRMIKTTGLQGLLK